MMKTYRINRFAEVEGSAAAGWTVFNLVTGLQSGPVWNSFKNAKAAAEFLGTYYTALEGR